MAGKNHPQKMRQALLTALPTEENLYSDLPPGRDRRRGIPYTWIVNHLADARGRVSPRTFLTAVREAAEDSSQRYEDYTFPLHYESIKRGVQKASSVRVHEVAEDYPWVGTLMQPLRGLVVPCEPDEIVDRWFTAFKMPSTLCRRRSLMLLVHPLSPACPLNIGKKAGEVS